MQVVTPKKGYKLVKTSFGKYEEIPEEWEFPELGKNIEIIMGQAPPSSTYNTIGEGKLFVRVGEFGEIFPEKAIWTTMPLVEAKASDVLICVVGATIGKTNLGINCAITRSVAALRPKKELLQKFLYYFLIFNLNLVKRKSHGSAQGILTKSHINDMGIPLPPLTEQKQISSILSNVDDVLQKTNQIIEQTQHLKKGMEQKFFTRDCKSQQWKNQPLSELVKLIIDHRGITPKKLGGDWVEKGIPVISAFNIKNFQLSREDQVRFISSSMAKKWMPEKLHKEDVLITSEGATLGQIAFLSEEKDYCTGQRLFVVRTKQKLLHGKFLYYFLISEEGQKQIFQRATGSTGQGIRQKELLKMSIHFPEYNLQQQISSILSNIDTQIQKEKLHKSNLEKLKKGLMQKLLIGQIRVKV